MGNNPCRELGKAETITSLELEHLWAKYAGHGEVTMPPSKVKHFIHDLADFLKVAATSEMIQGWIEDMLRDQEVQDAHDVVVQQFQELELQNCDVLTTGALRKKLTATKAEGIASGERAREEERRSIGGPSESPAKQRSSSVPEKVQHRIQKRVSARKTKLLQVSAMKPLSQGAADVAHGRAADVAQGRSMTISAGDASPRRGREREGEEEEEQEIEFAHFKRLFLAIIRDSGAHSDTKKLCLSASLDREIAVAAHTNVFGISVEEAAERSGGLYALVPAPVQVTVEYLNRPENITYEGMYRVPGLGTKIQEFMVAFDKGLAVQYGKYDQEEAAGVVMKFLKFLPASIFTAPLEHTFKAVNVKFDNDAQKGVELRRLLLQLPLANRETLRTLCAHFHRVDAHRAQNKMSVQNLAICLGFTGTMRFLVGHVHMGVFPDTLLYAVDVADAVARSAGPLPSCLEAAFSFLDKFGLNTPDLYRASGSHTRIRELIYAFNGGQAPRFSRTDVYNATAVVMVWFRDAKGLWGAREEEVIAAAQCLLEEDANERVEQTLLEVLERIPDYSITILKAFAAHLALMVESCPQTTAKGICCRFGRILSAVMPVLIKQAAAPTTEAASDNAAEAPAEEEIGKGPSREASPSLEEGRDVTAADELGGEEESPVAGPAIVVDEEDDDSDAEAEGEESDGGDDGDGSGDEERGDRDDGGDGDGDRDGSGGGGGGHSGGGGSEESEESDESYDEEGDGDDGDDEEGHWGLRKDGSEGEDDGGRQRPALLSLSPPSSAFSTAGKRRTTSGTRTSNLQIGNRARGSAH